jgi:acyl-CoA synthetase (AMP-forming)/AMP-acid ligase II
MAAMNSQPVTAPHARAPIPRILDELARANSGRVFVSIAESAEATSFLDVTYGQFANAVNKIAGVLDHQFGQGSSFPTIAYIGLPDIRYFMLLIAAIKVGHIVRIPNNHCS